MNEKHPLYSKITSCRICGSKDLKKILEFGNIDNLSKKSVNFERLKLDFLLPTYASNFSAAGFFFSIWKKKATD